VTSSSCITVSPPLPESKIPIGRSSIRGIVRTNGISPGVRLSLTPPFRLPFRPVAKIWAATAVAVLAALLAAGTAPSALFSQEDVTIVSADGTQLAATLFVPDGAPPAGGWPAVVYLHGLGGDRSSTIAIARLMGVVGQDYVVLAYDARGHGSSGGLIGIDGPNEVADARAVFTWLRDRADVADAKIGAWGISYGGGGAWNSLVAGVPWAAIEPVITWTDLERALVPQGLAKTGVVAGFISSLDPKKVDPEVLAVRDAAFAGQLGPIPAFAAARSSAKRLPGMRTPVFMMQGRRDFAFGLDQVRVAWAALKGPKRLWIGNMGHAPSSFPAPDTAAMLAEGKQWFDRFLRGVPNGVDGPKRVVVAASGTSKVTRFASFPATTKALFGFGRPTDSKTIGAQGKVVWHTGATPMSLEVFGAPTVKVNVRAAGGWSRLVAVLSARTPAGQEIVVSGGGVPLTTGRRTVTIRLIDQATFVPKGSRLTLTLASSSLAQNPGNLLYLDLPMPATARATIGPATMTLPVLTRAISR
jgi:predicted acyl esterase